MASALVLVQLLVAPYAHATCPDTGQRACGAMDHAQSTASHGCCTDPHHDGPTSGHHDGAGHAPHGRTHASCSCPCGHTPALSNTVATRVTFSVSIDRALPDIAPSSDPLQFELLRPPA